MSDSSNKIRTRFAPSPTGSLHIGSFQKILFSYVFAKKNNGDYVLRIEDTDQKRKVDDAIEQIFQVHELFRIEIDESLKNPGDYGPYLQSDRVEIYQKYARQLVESGYAYYAFETPEELSRQRQLQQKSGNRPKYNGKYRDLALEEADKLIKQGNPHVIRIKLPSVPTIVEAEDMIMGSIKVSTKDLDDYILLKSDGFPTYHLAVVVDDHLMKISHVFRGVEWIPTFPIHFLLYKYLGWQPPVFAHVPNILDPNGGKLSKRSGSVAAMDFLEQGYLTEAITNFMILLGWNPKTDRELFSLSDFIEEFSPDKFNKSNPTFNRDKLDWFNQQYIRQLSVQELKNRYFHNRQLRKHRTDNENSDKLVDISGLAENELEQALLLDQSRVTTLSEFDEKLSLYTSFTDPELEHKKIKKLSTDQKLQLLLAYKSQLEQNGDKLLENHDTWEQSVRTLADDFDMKAGQVFMLLRLAITGRAASPPLYEFIKIIGLSETIARLEKSIEIIG